MSTVPVIFLSAHDGEEHVVQALRMGADDYIVKPFSPNELVARIEASLRKRAVFDHAEVHKPYRLGELTIDYMERGVTMSDRPVQLTATEYKLLFELSINSGRVLTHDQILQRVWGPEYSGDAQAGASHGEEGPSQAGRGRERPEVHRNAAPRRLHDGQAAVIRFVASLLVDCDSVDRFGSLR